ncbi:MAG: cupin-like domain-containing protein [Pseudomonadota bacterium]
MRPVPEFHDVTRARFEREIVSSGAPAVLRGLCADWAAVAAARTSDDALAAYLRSAANDQPFEAWFGAPEIAGKFSFADNIGGYNHDRRLANIDQLLDFLLRQRGHDAPYAIFAGAIPIGRHLPGMAQDIAIPLLDPKREKLVSLWLGNRTKTAAHWDLPQNLACVIAGRRRFTLFPTDQVANLYVGPLDYTLAGQASSLVDLEAPDRERFPRFAQAEDAALSAELEPGDALYIPSLWWHGVSSLDELSAMLNFWWRDAQPPLMTPLNALYHAIITTSDLPPRELAAWRTLFDHYVFRDNGDPAAHLPEPVRGILGKRTPELVARVKKMLVEILGR